MFFSKNNDLVKFIERINDGNFDGIKEELSNERDLSCWPLQSLLSPFKYRSHWIPNIITFSKLRANFLNRGNFTNSLKNVIFFVNLIIYWVYLNKLDKVLPKLDFFLTKLMREINYFSPALRDFHRRS